MGGGFSLPWDYEESTETATRFFGGAGAFVAAFFWKTIGEVVVGRIVVVDPYFGLAIYVGMESSDLVWV